MFYAPEGKNAQPTGGHVFQATGTIFELVQNIIGTNLLKKFHDERTINTASRVLTRPTRIPTPHVGNGAIHKVQYQLEVNRCRNDEWPMWAGHPRIDRIVIRIVQYQLEVNRCKNVDIIVKGNFVLVLPIWAGRPRIDRIVIREVQYQLVVNRVGRLRVGNGAMHIEIDRIVIRKFQYQFELNRCRNEEIIEKGNFGWVWSMWAGRPRIDRIVIREAQYQFEVNRCRNEEEKCHVLLAAIFFSPTGTIFELIQDIIRTNHLTKFHDDRTINLASRVLTKKNAPPPDIIRKNLQTKFHEDRKINVASRVLTRKNAPPPCGHFHEDRTINVDSRVLTRFYYSHIRKNAPPTGGHVFQATGTIFELVQNIIGTNLLTKFHDERTINTASRVLTRGAPGLSDRIVIREVQYQLEVNRCRNDEWPMWAGHSRIDRIVIRIVQYQLELNRCKNVDIIVKGNFVWVWPIWAGRPRIDRIVIREVQYQLVVNRVGRLRVGNGAMHIEIDRVVIRKFQYQFELNRCRNEEIIEKGNF
ncbi:hypothetical protein DPMN_160059 [Dreissena polymorpha]|uniref:Uncharacterized protein n=1 Tax=Dreissena polymorpha TaxID=45954 RepID=A0A9D4IS80_DREPO|nr:hypothetical protein DPMN_160059 [Dreissena polymorpha]